MEKFPTPTPEEEPENEESAEEDVAREALQRGVSEEYPDEIRRTPEQDKALREAVKRARESGSDSDQKEMVSKELEASGITLSKEDQAESPNEETKKEQVEEELKVNCIQIEKDEEVGELDESEGGDVRKELEELGGIMIDERKTGDPKTSSSEDVRADEEKGDEQENS